MIPFKDVHEKSRTFLEEIPPGYMSLREIPHPNLPPAGVISSSLNHKQSSLFEFEDTWQYEMDQCVKNHDPKFSTFIRGLYKCGRYARTDCCPYHRLYGGDCDDVKVTITYCHSRFCSHPGCIKHRYAQAYSRLKSIRKFPVNFIDEWKVHKQKITSFYPDSESADCRKELRKSRSQFFFARKNYSVGFPRRVYHFAVGSIFLSKPQLDHELRNFLRRLRTRGYRVHYVKCFDIGRESFNTTNLYWLHYHIAMIPEFSSSGVSSFIEDCRAACDTENSSLVFKNIGFRDTENVFSYFSNRIAGRLGHRKTGYFFYSDIMNLDTYLKTFYNTKVCTSSLPKGLTCITATSLTINLCPVHHEPRIFTFYTRVDQLQTIDFEQNRAILD